MKLWQKIFLCSLFLIMIAIDITAVTILSDGHKMLLEREEQKNITEHAYFSANLANTAVRSRLRQNKVRLSVEETAALVEETLQSRPENFMVADAEGAIGQTVPGPLMAETAFIAEVQREEDVYLFKIVEERGRSYMLTGSSVKVEGLPYYVYSVADISDIYEVLDSQFSFVRWISLLFAGIIGAVLIVVVFHLLSPLGRINQTLGEIAQGDYALRLPETGGVEFRELSHSINLMAQSVEENVSHIQEIADSRKRFIDNLAHEMKTPLTSILGFADLLRVKRRVEDHERQEYAGIIVEETKRLRSLSGKLLELATTDSVQLDCEEVSVPELFEEVQAAVQLMLERRQIRFSIFPAQVSVWIDKELFQSLLYNLIDNAAKASAPGKEIRLLCTPKKGKVQIAVSDDGIGMSPANMRRAAEPFYMADKSRSRKAGGAGLGLSLCVEIARRHRAQILLNSEEGVGTTVRVILPQKKGEAQ